MAQVRERGLRFNSEECLGPMPSTVVSSLGLKCCSYSPWTIFQAPPGSWCLEAPGVNMLCNFAGTTAPALIHSCPEHLQTRSRAVTCSEKDPNPIDPRSRLFQASCKQTTSRRCEYVHGTFQTAPTARRGCLNISTWKIPSHSYDAETAGRVISLCLEKMGYQVYLL